MHKALFHTPLLLLLLLLGALAQAATAEPLTLRINDTAGEAGDLVAVTLRTYASRPVHQGQVCFRANFVEGAAQPFGGFAEALIFSATGDATGGGSFNSTTQVLMLDLFSASSTINSVDGPLAVIYLRLASGLPSGAEFELQLDEANTFLVDANGNPIPIEPRSGTLTIRAPGDPHELSAEGVEAAPGSQATLAAGTEAIFPLSAGQVGYRFDPSVVAQVLDASIDPRYGDAQVTFTEPEPGLVLLDFQSPNSTVNWIPGDFLHLTVRIAPDAVIGTTSALTLDPVLTSLLDRQGQVVPLLLESDLLEIVPPSEIFSDAFESGSTASWSIVVPGN